MCTAQLMCLMFISDCPDPVHKFQALITIFFYCSNKSWILTVSKYFLWPFNVIQRKTDHSNSIFFKFKLFMKGFNIFLCRGQKCGSVRKIWQPSVHHSTWFLVFSKLWFRDWSNVLTLGIPEGTNQSINQSIWRNCLCMPCLLLRFVIVEISERIEYAFCFLLL